MEPMKPRRAPGGILVVVCASFLALPASLRAQEFPVGAYLWFPEPGGPKSEQDCRDLVARVKPSKEKAEMSLWGTIPESDPAAGSFYLLLSGDRMETTFAAEGDYDFGDVRLGETRNGETPFTLVPDDHPDVTVQGTIVAKPGSEIVTVILRGIPVDSSTTDRTTYYCRFQDLGTETLIPSAAGQTLTSMAVPYMKETPAAKPAIVAGAVSAAGPLPSDLMRYAVTSTMT
jgi:hypothetical protein